MRSFLKPMPRNAIQRRSSPNSAVFSLKYILSVMQKYALTVVMCLLLVLDMKGIFWFVVLVDQPVPVVYCVREICNWRSVPLVGSNIARQGHMQAPRGSPRGNMHPIHNRQELPGWLLPACDPLLLEVSVVASNLCYNDGAAFLVIIEYSNKGLAIAQSPKRIIRRTTIPGHQPFWVIHPKVVT